MSEPELAPEPDRKQKVMAPQHYKQGTGNTDYKIRVEAMEAFLAEAVCPFNTTAAQTRAAQRGKLALAIGPRASPDSPRHQATFWSSLPSNGLLQPSATGHSASNYQPLAG
jgi:hypothetical protein